jgi:hypothetical protein
MGGHVDLRFTLGQDGLGRPAADRHVMNMIVRLLMIALGIVLMASEKSAKKRFPPTYH